MAACHDCTRHRPRRLARDQPPGPTPEPSCVAPRGGPGHSRDVPAPAVVRRPAGAGRAGRGSTGGRCARGLSPRAPERRPASFSPGSAATIVARPGDTLWSIATRLAPGDDPRAARRRAGRSPRRRTRCVPGESVRLPGADRSRRERRVAGSDGRRRYRGGRALPVLPGRRRQGRRLPAGRRRRARSGAGASASPAAAASRPTSGSSSCPLMVVKRSGAQEPFDRAKLAVGIERAVAGRAVAPAAVDEALRESRRSPGRGARGAPASGSGWRCSSGCGSLDHVSYLRFASVYKGFDDLGRLRARGRGAPEDHGAQAPAPRPLTTAPVAGVVRAHGSLDS